MFQENSGFEKTFGKEGEGNHKFASKRFCITVLKNFAREHFGVSENFGIEKFCAKRRIFRFSFGNCLSHSSQKRLTWNPSWFQINSGIKTFHSKEVEIGITFFHRNN